MLYNILNFIILIAAYILIHYRFFYQTKPSVEYFLPYASQGRNRPTHLTRALPHARQTQVPPFK